MSSLFLISTFSCFIKPFELRCTDSLDSLEELSFSLYRQTLTMIKAKQHFKFIGISLLAYFMTEGNKIKTIKRKNNSPIDLEEDFEISASEAVRTLLRRDANSWRHSLYLRLMELDTGFLSGTNGRAFKLTLFPPDTIINLSYLEKKGLVITVAGASGTGKSLCLSVLAWIIRTAYQNILINGRVVTAEDRKKIVWIISSQLSELLLGFKIGENIAATNPQLDYDSLKFLLELFDSTDLDIDRVYNGKNISGGQKQRIILIRAIVALLISIKSVLIFKIFSDPKVIDQVVEEIIEEEESRAEIIKRITEQAAKAKKKIKMIEGETRLITNKDQCSIQIILDEITTGQDSTRCIRLYKSIMKLVAVLREVFGINVNLFVVCHTKGLVEFSDLVFYTPPFYSDGPLFTPQKLIEILYFQSIERRNLSLVSVVKPEIKLVSINNNIKYDDELLQAGMRKEALYIRPRAPIDPIEGFTYFFLFWSKQSFENRDRYTVSWFSTEYFEIPVDFAQPIREIPEESLIEVGYFQIEAPQELLKKNENFRNNLKYWQIKPEQLGKNFVLNKAGEVEIRDSKGELIEKLSTEDETNEIINFLTKIL